MGSGPKTGTSPAVIRVLTVDDHALIREGVAALIANQKDMRLVGEASNGREAIARTSVKALPLCRSELRAS